MTDLEREETLARRQAALNEEFTRRDNEQEDADIKAWLSTEAGRRIFAGIIGRGGVFASLRGACGGDQMRLAFETGRREYAVEIYRKANYVAPDMVIKAISERNAVCAARRERMNALRDELGN